MTDTQPHPTRLSLADIELEAISFSVAFPETPERLKLSKAMGRAVGVRAGAESDFGGRKYVDAVSLPSDPALSYYFLLHVHAQTIGGKEDEPPIKALLAHGTFQEKPESDPPPRYAKLRDQGRTMEWAVEQLGKIVAGKDSLYSISVQGRVKARAPLSAATIQPLKDPARGDLLECGGMEYRRKSSKEAGLSRFRWSTGADDRLNVWLSYGVVASSFAPNFVEAERARCLEYLATFLG